MGSAAAGPGHRAHESVLVQPDGAGPDGRSGRDQGRRLRRHVLKPVRCFVVGALADGVAVVVPQDVLLELALELGVVGEEDVHDLLVGGERLDPLPGVAFRGDAARRLLGQGGAVDRAGAARCSGSRAASRCGGSCGPTSPGGRVDPEVLAQAARRRRRRALPALRRAADPGGRHRPLPGLPSARARRGAPRGDRGARGAAGAVDGAAAAQAGAGPGTRGREGRRLGVRAGLAPPGRKDDPRGMGHPLQGSFGRSCTRSARSAARTRRSPLPTEETSVP